jgi:hypothetical protein
VELDIHSFMYLYSMVLNNCQGKLVIRPSDSYYRYSLVVSLLKMHEIIHIGNAVSNWPHI